MVPGWVGPGLLLCMTHSCLSKRVGTKACPEDPSRGRAVRFLADVTGCDRDHAAPAEKGECGQSAEPAALPGISWATAARFEVRRRHENQIEIGRDPGGLGPEHRARSACARSRAEAAAGRSVRAAS